MVDQAVIFPPKVKLVSFNNGLKGASLIVYNYLLQTGPKPLRISEIARDCGYASDTIFLVLIKLESYGYIKRHRPHTGVPYTYEVVNDVFPYS